MKSFKEISRSQKILTIAAGLLAGGIFIFNDQDSDYATQGGGYPVNENGSYTVNAPAETAPVNQTYNSQPMNSQGKVVLYDKGLQMPIGTYTLPEGWSLTQDVATDPATNKSIQYNVEMSGPRGEMIRSLGNAQYGQMVGKSFEQAWYQTVMAGLQGEFGQINFGTFQPDPLAQQNALKIKVIQRLLSQGGQVQCLQAPISAQRNGQMIKGIVTIMKMDISPAMGSVTVGCAIAPASEHDQLMQARASIIDNYVPNPAYEQRREQIQAGVQNQIQAYHNQQMAASQSAHQQRMANNQAAFNAHQQRMGQMSQTQDASFNNYMNNSRNNNSSAWSNSGYSGQNAIVDQIHERSTFENPDTGYDISLDGQYDYNYTNGLGDYYRTNDPSFDQNSLQGDWQLVDPRSPNY
ncbi:MAG: hypothetical protein RIG62_04345 [Cyclobacteriaceae bacterium]